MHEPKMIDDVLSAGSAGAGIGTAFFLGRWIITWFTARFDRRQAVLDAQDGQIDQEWSELREELKRDKAEMKKHLTRIERQNEALRFSFHHVAAALMKVDPLNPALALAEQLLTQAFPLDLRFTAERAAFALDQDEAAG